MQDPASKHTSKTGVGWRRKRNPPPRQPTKCKFFLALDFLLSRYFSLSSFKSSRRAWISSCDRIKNVNGRDGRNIYFFLLKHLPPLASGGGGFVQAQSWGMRKVREQAVLFWNYLQSKCNLQTPTLLQEQQKKKSSREHNTSRNQQLMGGVQEQDNHIVRFCSKPLPASRKWWLRGA